MMRAMLALLPGLLGLQACACEAPRCPPPLEVLPGGSCFAKPAAGVRDAPIAIYLHGMTTDPQHALREGRLLADAVRGSAAVLVPLGTKGACTWSPDLANHHCWPTTGVDQQEVEKLVGRLRADLAEVQRRTGATQQPAAFLVGFSNGGFGAARIAATTDLPLAGLAILHAGGAASVDTAWRGATLLRAATGDEWHYPSMVELRDRFAAAGTPATWQEREGAHVFSPDDAAAVAAFFLQGAERDRPGR